MLMLLSMLLSVVTRLQLAFKQTADVRSRKLKLEFGSWRFESKQQIKAVIGLTIGEGAELQLQQVGAT